VYVTGFALVLSNDPPEKVHATAVFGVPETIAPNCCVAPGPTVTLGGVTTTIASVTVMVTVADRAWSARLVAVAW